MPNQPFVSTEAPVQEFLAFMSDRSWPCPWAKQARDEKTLTAVLAPPMDKNWIGTDHRTHPEIQRRNIDALQKVFEQVIEDILEGRAKAGFVVEQDDLSDIGEAYGRTWGLIYPSLSIAASNSKNRDILYGQLVQKGERFSNPLYAHEYLDYGIPTLPQTETSPRSSIVFNVMGPHYPDELGRHMRWAPTKQVYSLTSMAAVYAARLEDQGSGHLRKHIAVAKQTAQRCHRIFNNNIPFPLSIPEHDAPVFSFYVQWATAKRARGIIQPSADVLKVAKQMNIGFLEGLDKLGMEKMLEEKGFLNTAYRKDYTNKIPAGIEFIMTAVQTMARAKKEGVPINTVES